MDIPCRMQASGPARVLLELYQIIALGVNGNSECAGFERVDAGAQGATATSRRRKNIILALSQNTPRRQSSASGEMSAMINNTMLKIVAMPCQTTCKTLVIRPMANNV